ncbi:hypothetical protein FIV42_11950 [Persicimonas caeni]|uniref:Uncharacterized protein n=1 Tax=Persicimonas caeni TaxID=2292766 RepID=A0A4Y6PTH5_PERCE|nr:hypothetical protein [Persicimonas caeni]QDG51429.1 hypothetical protein FIV42_11950 [Persicimonas caeni]QED32650.1 hypothetical protein FRD00_11945 [Persicimonas caeni]
MSRQNAENEHANNSLKSKLSFFAVIAVIVAGTAFWYLLTLWASEPVGPEIAKKMAEDFEHECFLDLQDEEQCRKLIGQNHRDCLFDNIEKVEPGMGDNGGNVVHDRDGYLTCMREKTGVSY